MLVVIDGLNEVEKHLKYARGYAEYLQNLPEGYFSPDHSHRLRIQLNEILKWTQDALEATYK